MSGLSSLTGGTGTKSGLGQPLRTKSAPISGALDPDAAGSCALGAAEADSDCAATGMAAADPRSRDPANAALSGRKLGARDRADLRIIASSLLDGSACPGTGERRRTQAAIRNRI